mgnify:CR=1 FL=1
MFKGLNCMKSNKHGFVAGMAVSSALLLNDLVIFGNLNLNTVSILMLSVIGISCAIGFLIVSKEEKTYKKPTHVKTN